LSISEAQPAFVPWGNVNTSRAECQIYLSISEVQPTFAPLGQRECKPSGMAPKTIGPRLWHKAGARAVWGAKIHRFSDVGGILLTKIGFGWNFHIF
jgi:hypothetical protein